MSVSSARGRREYGSKPIFKHLPQSEQAAHLRGGRQPADVGLIDKGLVPVVFDVTIIFIQGISRVSIAPQAPPQMSPFFSSCHHRHHR